MREKALDELYQDKEKLLLFMEFADIYGGSIETDDIKYTAEELQEKLKAVDMEIAARLSSKSYLKFIKSPKKK